VRKEIAEDEEGRSNNLLSMLSFANHLTTSIVLGGHC